MSRALVQFLAFAFAYTVFYVLLIVIGAPAWAATGFALVIGYQLRPSL